MLLLAFSNAFFNVCLYIVQRTVHFVSAACANIPENGRPVAGPSKDVGKHGHVHQQGIALEIMKL